MHSDGHTHSAQHFYQCGEVRASARQHARNGIAPDLWRGCTDDAPFRGIAASFAGAEWAARAARKRLPDPLYQVMRRSTRPRRRLDNEHRDCVRRVGNPQAVLRTAEQSCSSKLLQCDGCTHVQLRRVGSRCCTGLRLRVGQLARLEQHVRSHLSYQRPPTCTNDPGPARISSGRAPKQNIRAFSPAPAPAPTATLTPAAAR